MQSHASAFITLFLFTILLLMTSHDFWVDFSFLRSKKEMEKIRNIEKLATGKKQKCFDFESIRFIDCISIEYEFIETQFSIPRGQFLCSYEDDAMNGWGFGISLHWNSQDVFDQSIIRFCCKKLPSSLWNRVQFSYVLLKVINFIVKIFNCFLLNWSRSHPHEGIEL